MALIEIHVHGDLNDKKLEEILSQLIQIKTKMAKSREEFGSLAAEIRASLTNLSDDITRLTDRLQGGGLTEAQEEEVYAEFRSLADDVKALADRTPEEPETPPTPTT
jgi:septation ring formation regulator EzrA